jgi:tRNA(Ile)-lysidine synthase
LLQQFTNYIEQKQLFTAKQKLLVAVSGGLDSVVLCYLCKQAGFNFAMAHCNFNLRGEESKRDKNFVIKLAEQLEVPLYVTDFDTQQYIEQHKVSVQVAARELRYSYFNELLLEHKLDYILTAHHANDNVETVLMNIVKGTGIKGLRGILPKQTKTIRPLLFAKREEILAYAIQNKINFVEDSSNIKTEYTRNFLRHNVMPPLLQMNSAAVNNIAENIERYAQIELIYNEHINKQKKNLLETNGKEKQIAILKLTKQTAWQTLLYEILVDFNFAPSQLQEIIKLLKADTGSYVASATHRIIKNRNWLIITELNSTESGSYVLDTANTKVDFNLGSLQITTVEKPADLNVSTNVAFVDAKVIAFPLILRKWKQGDYFYPLGMPKKKKLSKFFIDNKLSLTQKENIWVLESNKKIIWVLGMRIDDRFKITYHSTSVLKLHLVQ